jgi:hypothetical protein
MGSASLLFARRSELVRTVVSVKYGIPTTLFHVMGRAGLNFTNESIRYLFNQIDTHANAARLMAEIGLPGH